MKIRILTLGKPREAFIAHGVEHYQVRLKQFLPLEWVFLSEVGKGKKLTNEQRIILEGQEFLRRIEGQDFLFLLDENGRQFRSEEFSGQIYSLLAQGQGNIIFLVGGPWGTSDELKNRANAILSLSKMTFTHEMALLLLAEQLYRAAAIYNGSKYHHGRLGGTYVPVAPDGAGINH